MSNNQRKVLVVWDDENYTMDAALKDGAATLIPVPKDLSQWEYTQWKAGLLLGLRAGGERISNYPEKLKCKEMVQTEYVVGLEVLEWNTYTHSCWAFTEDEARKTVRAEGVSRSHIDVECGTSSFVEGQPTNDRLVNV